MTQQVIQQAPWETDRWQRLEGQLSALVNGCIRVVRETRLPYFGAAEYIDSGSARIEFGLIPTPRLMEKMKETLPTGCNVKLVRDDPRGPRLVFTVPVNHRQAPAIEVLTPPALPDGR